MFTEVYFDGACHGDTGKSGGGVYIKDCHLGVAVGMPKGTNNTAEWMALIAGLDRAATLGYRDIHIIGDSQLVLHCASHKWQTHKPHLQELLALSDQLLAAFDSTRFTWVKRDYNTTADWLSNQGYKVANGKMKLYPQLPCWDVDYEAATRLYQQGKIKIKSRTTATKLPALKATRSTVNSACEKTRTLDLTQAELTTAELTRIQELILNSGGKKLQPAIAKIDRIIKLQTAACGVNQC